MDPNKKTTPFWKYALISSIVFLIIIVIRIFNVPITHDEGITVTRYTTQHEGPIMAMANEPTANNHILNTLLAKFFVTLWGYSYFAIRLPNLLAYICFLYFSARMVRGLFNEQKIGICVFLLLSLNPFVFEFWGLCRGYGISIALMTTSIFYLLAYVEKKRTGLLYLSLFLAIASVYSNLSLLNFYLGLLGTIMLIPIKEHRKWTAPLLAVIINTGILVAFIYQPITQLKLNDQLYYGGTTGFVQDTIHSLVTSSLFLEKGNTFTLLVSYLVGIIVFCMSIHTIWMVLAKRRDTASTIKTQLILNTLFLIPVVSTIAQHYILGTRFLIDRTALFFIPLFIFAFTYYLNGRYHRFFSVSTIILTLFALINFCMHINVTSTFFWKYNLYEKIVMDRTLRNHTDTNSKISIRAHWLFAPPFQYYLLNDKYKDQFVYIWYEKKDIDTTSTFDYYYVKEGDLASLSPIYIVDTSFEGKYYLMKKAK